MAMFTKRRVRLTYPPALLDQPILSSLITQFNVLLNVVEANVTTEQGWFVVDLQGSAEAVVRGLDWVAEQGIQVEEMSRS